MVTTIRITSNVLRDIGIGIVAVALIPIWMPCLIFIVIGQAVRGVFND